MNNREIKFRAWDYINNRMIFPSLFTVIDGNSVFKLNPHHVDNNYYKLEDNGKFSICQFTGLKDSEGVDIYEGDEVIYTLNHDSDQKELKSTIEWYRYAWRLNKIWLLTEIRTIKVIGNIYQNKE